LDKNASFFKTYDITNQQFNILRILRGQYPTKISGAEIKSRMIDKNSDVSRLLDRLLAKNLIEKTPCPQDKRAADVMISEKGLSLLLEIDEKLDETDTAVINLNSAEAEQLSLLLDKCRER
jgi:DNA-binding MarR family transcriptional regulator